MDIEAIRKDFPALQQKVYDKPLIYLDNAATSQKPQVVIDRITQYYQRENSNVHRGVHFLSQTATDHYEATRTRVQQLIRAEKLHEVIYTKGTTEGINLVAYSFGEKYVNEGDEIIISQMEHHSNIVPWQMLASRKGATVKVIPMDETGTLDLEAYRKLLSDRTKMVAVTHVSNSLGTINPIQQMVADAHAVGAAVLVDGAQAAPHMQIDVKALDVDFYVFSGHKVFGPTGIGILYGKEKWLTDMPPYMGGGDMIELVRFDKTTYAGLPHKFEAGTPNIADTIALSTALEYVESVGYQAIADYEAELLAYGTEKLRSIDGIKLIGTAEDKASVLSFVMEGIHPYDAGTLLDRMGIAVRTGHHCTQPVMQFFDVPGTIRASFAFYNTKEEIDKLIAGLQKVKEFFV